MTTVCHCRGCQRMSSSAYALTAIMPADALEVTQGETVIGGIHGPESQHHFCAYCMTWMFTRSTQVPQIVNVRPTMFEDTSWTVPFMETFTKTKLPWVTTPAKRSFEEFPSPEMYGELMKEYAQVK